MARLTVTIVLAILSSVSVLNCAGDHPAAWQFLGESPPHKNPRVFGKNRPVMLGLQHRWHYCCVWVAKEPLFYWCEGPGLDKTRHRIAVLL